MPDPLRDQLQASLGAAYTLERELGGGGMARVFLAEDTALGRRVVVKVLSPELAEGLSAERFAREVRLAARLQHPNIVPVLAAGAGDGGLPYYTMPFIDGASLRERLAAGPLPVPEALALLRDVARALAYAHGQGVVHRDVKPENVLLSGGAAAVTDFGIAKALSAAAAGGATLTQLGTAIGTPAYMAPEQAAGDPDVGPRADLYAWGLVAWEALAGRHPFADRRTPLALIGAHLTQVPVPLAAVRADVPPALAALVARCLAKDPAARPPDAAEVLRALDGVALTPRASSPAAATSATRERAPALAVLPFANFSPDFADEYFADGLTDELITDLAGIRTLRVTARGSVMRLKGTAKGHEAIAAELGVRYLVTGGVRRAGDGIRVTAALHDTAEDATLWTDKIGGSLGDVFAIQEQIARRIADALRLVLSADERRRLGEHPLTDLRAYECLLQARHELWTFATSSLDRARRLLENALALVGENARLCAALGQVHLNHIETGQGDAAAHLARAEHYAARADALDPHSAPVLWLRGAIRWKHGAIREAIDALERARMLEPSNAELVSFLTYAYLLAGRDADAREAAEESTRLDPLTPLLQCMPGLCEQMAGRPEAAVPYYRKFLAMDPDNPAAQLFLVWILAGTGEADEADEAIALGEALRGGFPDTVFGVLGGAFALALQGRHDEARGSVTAQVRAAASSVEFLARFLAHLMALSGDPEAAIDALEQSVRLGMAHWPYLAERDRWLAPLRGHPRFERLLAVVHERWARGGASAADHPDATYAPVPAPA